MSLPILIILCVNHCIILSKKTHFDAWKIKDNITRLSKYSFGELFI